MNEHVVKATFVAVYQSGRAIRTLKSRCLVNKLTHEITDDLETEFCLDSGFDADQCLVKEFVSFDTPDGFITGVYYKAVPKDEWDGLPDDLKKQAFWYGENF